VRLGFVCGRKMMVLAYDGICTRTVLARRRALLGRKKAVAPRYINGPVMAITAISKHAGKQGGELPVMICAGRAH